MEPVWMWKAEKLRLHELLVALSMGPDVLPDPFIDPAEVIGAYAYDRAILLVKSEGIPHHIAL